MSKITRQTQKLFGSSAGANQIAQFGSLNNGTPTFTTSIATIQALSNYLVGWYNAVIGGNSPAIEDMNALCYLFSYQIGYVLQEGVPEWDSGTTYYTGCIVNDGTGNLYVSIQDSNANHLVTDTTWWRITSPSGLAQYCMFVGDSNGAAQPANTSLIGDVSAQYVSQSYTVTSAAPGVFTVAVSPLTGQTAYVTVTQNGFTASTRYYVTKVSGTTFKLATTLANALAGTNITSSGTVAGVIISGGMAVATGSLANPMTVLGDLFYGGSTPAAGTPTRLAGDTSDTRKFLRSLSSSGTATAPAWDVLAQGDLPALSQYNVNVGDSSNLAKQLNTNLLGEIQGTYVSQSYAVTSAAPGVFTVAVAPATGASAYVTVTQNGFTASTRYYVTNVSGTTFKLATTLANAVAGTNITSSGTVAGVIISGGFVLSSGVKGTVTNDTATAGYVGEYIEGTAADGAVSLSSGTVADIVSGGIVLTAGCWDISGVALYAPLSGSTSVTRLECWIGTATGNSSTGLDRVRNFGAFETAANVIGAAWFTILTPIFRVNLSGSTTYYLKANAVFSVAGLGVGGTIRATRVR